MGFKIFSNFQIQKSAKLFSKGIRNELKEKFKQVDVVHNKGVEILNDPLTNQTLAYNSADRDRLSLRGLLPHKIYSMDEQAMLYMAEYEKGVMEQAAINPDKDTLASGVTPKMIRQWKVLQGIQDRDETLFYYLLSKYIKEMAPIIYTPTVGWVCKNYSKMFRRPRGLYISLHDKGEINTLLENCPSDDIDAIVVTDGSRILGLGDLGIGGLGISIGKLDLYVAAGGFHPKRILPVVIDVGTNNEKLLEDSFYLGIKKHRITGEAYYDLIDEFMIGVSRKWPKALVQFEDFELKHALKLLDRYRDEFLIFNDDIQGTAAIVLSGIIGALKIQKLPSSSFVKQKFVVVGAGSAGMGVVHSIQLYLQRYGLSEEEAALKFCVLDKSGLITQSRPNLSPGVKKIARPETELDGSSILDVIKHFKPTCLIGLSGTGGIFTPDIISQMNDQPKGLRPIIFPLSNPTTKAECTAEDAQKYTNNNAIFGSGSPFEDVVCESGMIKSNQVNNVYIYPGLALGSFLGDTKMITDSMIVASAEALTETIPEKDYDKRSIYPCLSKIKEISVHIAARVMEQAHRERKLNNTDAILALKQSTDHLKAYIRRNQWKPEYRHQIYIPSNK